MLLEVRDLVVRYDKVEALKGVSLTVDQGEVVCLVGVNGAGKSTLLRAICGLKDITSGEIIMEGRRINSLATSSLVARGIALVPEGRRLFTDMSTMDNLRVGAFLRKDKNKIAQDIEELFEHFPILKERRKQRAGSLSGGEQQMLAMARALMSKPKLLLMDEPSMGLSPIMVSEVSDIIKIINQNGVSVLLIEQNASMALRVSQRGYVMANGSVVLADTCSQLLSNDYVQRIYLGVQA